MGQIEAIPTAQIDIRKQNVDGHPRQDDLSLLCTGGCKDLKSSVRQRLGGDFADNQLVLYDQNPLAEGLRGGFLCCGWAVQK